MNPYFRNVDKSMRFSNTLTSEGEINRKLIYSLHKAAENFKRCLIH
jgi:hypothetical protein